MCGSFSHVSITAARIFPSESAHSTAEVSAHSRARVDETRQRCRLSKKARSAKVEGGVFALKGEGRVQTDDVGFARQVCKRVRFALRRIATQHPTALGGQDFGNSRPDVSDTYDADGQIAEICAALCRR